MALASPRVRPPLPRDLNYVRREPHAHAFARAGIGADRGADVLAVDAEEHQRLHAELGHFERGVECSPSACRRWV
jgi:hypothetical protein